MAFTAYARLLQRAPLPLVNMYVYVNPVVAVLLGWLILGEPLSPPNPPNPPSPPTAPGGAIVVAVVFPVVRSER